MMNDLISRNAAIKEAYPVVIEGEKFDVVQVETLIGLPSAQKKGKWVMKEDPYSFFGEIPVCSECGCTNTMREKYTYCPHCVAYMREE